VLAAESSLTAALSVQDEGESTRVAEQVSAIECNSLECIGGKAVAAAVLQPTPASPAATADAPVSSTAPYPRPRPNRAG
jgi:hypothetical protein